MKTILEIDPKIKMACPMQKQVPDDRFRLSSLSIAVQTEDGMLIYSNLTGEMLLLSQEEYTHISDDDALRCTLAKKWFLVPENFSDIDHVEQVRDVLRIMMEPRDHISHFMIFPTTDCNARCFYCYELGGSRKTMTEDTAYDVAKYIIKKSKGYPVTLRWFGGEPLFNSKVIDIIISELHEAGVELRSNILSNGYLITEEIADKMKNQWNVFSIQITLDGTEDVYNKTKAYYQCKENAFLKVMDNIDKLLSRKVHVNIRLNMDSNNADDLSELIKILAARFGKYNTLTVYVAPLRDWGQKIHEFAIEEEGIRKLHELNRLIEELLPPVKCAIRHDLPLSRCMADNDGYITILPDGRLGKCEHYFDSGFIGSIYSDKVDEKMVASFKKRRAPQESCKHCVTYSHCIMLEKCVEGTGPCLKIVRESWHESLRRRVAATYQAYKDGTLDELTVESPFDPC